MDEPSDSASSARAGGVTLGRDGKAGPAEVFERLIVSSTELAGLAESLAETPSFGRNLLGVAARLRLISEDLRTCREPAPYARALNDLVRNHPAIPSSLLRRSESSYRYVSILLLTDLVRAWMTPEEKEAAWAAKLVHFGLAQLLDDLVDDGRVPADAVERSFAAVFAGLFVEDSQTAANASLVRRQFGEFAPPSGELALEMVAVLRGLLRGAAHFKRVTPALREDVNLFARGQALSALLRGPRPPIPEIRSRAALLPAPYPDIVWQDRLAKSLTFATSLTLIDLAFAHGLPSGFDLERHLRAWYLVDVIMGESDHLATLRADRARELTNSAALLLYPGSTDLVGEGVATLEVATAGKYEVLLTHWASLARRALDLRPPTAPGSGDVYGDIALGPALTLLPTQLPFSAEHLFTSYLSALADRR
jgi:hypothetical protein